jgi:transcription initiation factor TFIIH subunit 4
LKRSALIFVSFLKMFFNSREIQAVGVTLSELGVWRTAAIPGGLAAWELCPIFKKCLKTALLGG